MKFLIKISVSENKMLIYLEKKAKKYPLSKKIISRFDSSKIIEINSYKNIFDKNIWDFPVEKSIIIATTNDSITKAPDNYWPSKHSYFFKTWINCVFDCKYCYLKWAFKNNFLVFFVNYDEIQKSIENKINEIRKSWYDDLIYFYASDYSDIQAVDNITEFNRNFIDFFDKFGNVVLESRTKSSNINSLLNLKKIPKNFEIAFSLSPSEIIEKYEIWSSKLNSRIEAINKLINKWFRVWLRFLPLLPINNYTEIYSEFLDEIIQKIDISKISSIQIWWLIYTIDDYKNILKKQKNVDILYKLEENDDKFIRLNKDIRNNLYKLFEEKLWNFNICLDNF